MILSVKERKKLQIFRLRAVAPSSEWCLWYWWCYSFILSTEHSGSLQWGGIFRLKYLNYLKCCQIPDFQTIVLLKYLGCNYIPGTKTLLIKMYLGCNSIKDFQTLSTTERSWIHQTFRMSYYSSILDVTLSKPFRYFEIFKLLDSPISPAVWL